MIRWFSVFARPLMAGAFVLLPALAVQAADRDISPACQLLGASDLAKLKFALTGRPRGNTLPVKAEQSGAPSSLIADICFFYEGVEGGRTSANVTVETFAHMKGVAKWLESKNVIGANDGTLISKFGETTCEQGRYAFANPNAADKASQDRQHYVACDRIRGNRHVSLTFEVPDGDEGLPEPEAVKRLLDTVIGRLPAPAR